MPVKCPCPSSARARQVPVPVRCPRPPSTHACGLLVSIACPVPSPARIRRVLVEVGCSCRWIARTFPLPGPSGQPGSSIAQARRPFNSFFVVAFRSFTSTGDLATWLRGAEEARSAVEDGPSHPTGSVGVHRYHIFGRSHGRLVPYWPNLFVLFFAFWTAHRDHFYSFFLRMDRCAAAGPCCTLRACFLMLLFMYGLTAMLLFIMHGLIAKAARLPRGAARCPLPPS